MGTPASTPSLAQKSKKFSLVTYSYLDKLLFVELQYLNNVITDSIIKLDLPFIPHLDFIKEKEDKIKQSRFNKWYKMAYQFCDNCFLSLSLDSIKESLQSDINESLLKPIQDTIIAYEREAEISYCEQGMRAYYIANPSHFEQRVIKGPAESFRWLSWLICAGIPINRPSEKYMKLLSFDLDIEAEEQIQKDITRTLGDSPFNTQNIQNKLYRLLKSIALIDKEMSYVQGINFLCAFFLFVPFSNEIDTFYFLIGLFSMTFSYKFGMRDFYTNQFPLINVCTTIFEDNLKKKFPKLSAHINKIQLPSLCWVNPWMQMIFVNVFPSEAVLRIWDAFFVQGIPFLISFALSVTELVQDDVIGINDLCQINEYFKLLNPNGKNNYKGKKKEINYDIDKLIERAITVYPIELSEIDNLIRKDFPEVQREVTYNYKHINEYLDYKLNNLNIKNKMNIVQGETITFTPEKQSKIEIVNGANGKEGIEVKAFDSNDDDYFKVDDENDFDETSNHMSELTRKNKVGIRIKSYPF